MCQYPNALAHDQAIYELYRYARSAVPVAARREPCTVWQAGGTRLIPAAGVPR